MARLLPRWLIILKWLDQKMGAYLSPVFLFTFITVVVACVVGVISFVLWLLGLNGDLVFRWSMAIYLAIYAYGFVTGWFKK